MIVVQHFLGNVGFRIELDTILQRAEDLLGLLPGEARRLDLLAVRVAGERVQRARFANNKLRRVVARRRRGRDGRETRVLSKLRSRVREEVVEDRLDLGGALLRFLHDRQVVYRGLREALSQRQARSFELGRVERARNWTGPPALGRRVVRQ